MGQLTDRLGITTEGRPTQAPVRPAPSIFESIAETGGNLIQAQTTADQVRARRSASERQARLDARQAAEDSAANDAAAALPDLMHPGGIHSNELADFGPATNEAVSAALQEIPGLQNMQQAVGQDRLTRDAFELRLDVRIRDLIRRHPGQAAAITEEFRKNGLITPLAREYTEAAADVRDQEENDREYRQTRLNEARSFLNMDVTPENEAAAIEAAELRIQGIDRAEITDRLIRSQNTQQEMGERTRRETRLRMSRNIYQSFENTAGAQLLSVTQRLTQLALDPTVSDTIKNQRISEIIAGAEQGAQLQLQAFMGRYGAQLENDDRSAIERQVTGYVSNLRGLVTGDNSIVQRNVRHLQQLQTQLGIDVQTALPLFTELRAVMGNGPAADAFIASIYENTQLRGQVARELRGYRGLQPGEAHTRIMNVASILTGNSQLRDYGPAEARRMMPVILQNMAGLVRNPEVRTGRNAEGHKSALTAIGAVSNAAIEAVPQWQAPAINAALGNLTGNMVTSTLTANANPDERRIIINGYIPAVTRLIQAGQHAPTGDRYFDIQFNRRTNQFEAHRNATPDPFWQHPSPGLGFMRTEARPDGRVAATQSEATRQTVIMLNRGVNALTDLSARGLDRSVPADGISDVQRRRFYATGEVPPAMRQRQAEQAAAPARTWQQNANDLESSVVSWIGNATFTPGEFEDDPTASTSTAINRAENATGNHNARNPNSTATGDGQFIENTWVDLASRHLVDETRGMSRAQILELRGNPAISARMTRAYALENGQALAEAGLPHGPAELSLAHFAGARGAISILRADPNTPIEQIMTPEAIRANPFLRGKTAGEIIRWAANRIRRS